MSRICVVRQFYVPLDPRVNREVQALLRAGHEVDVVCLRAAGEPARERVEGVRFYRLPLSKRRGRGPLGIVTEYAVFFVAAAVLVGVLHVRRRYDIVQVNSLPDPLVFVGVLPRLMGARIALDLHECMPEFFGTKFGVPLDHPVPRLIAAAEQASIRFADAAFTCTDLMRDAFVSRGASAEKITVVLNGTDEATFDSDRFPPRPADGEFHLISHGSVEERYGLDTVIRAMALLKDDLPCLRFKIYGDGAFLPELRRMVVELGVADRVWFSGGYVPLEEVVRAIAECDVGVVGLKKDAFRDLTLANKMYDFIAMRKPALVSRTRSVEAYFDEAAFALYESDDANDLARAIRELHDDAQRRSSMVDEAARQGAGHRWPPNCERYLGVIGELAAAS